MKLHYKGNHVDFDRDRLYGPDNFGARYQPLWAEYDEELDRTTIHFKPFVEPK